MIFFGVFYAVIAVMVTSLLFITAKSVTDVYRTMKSNGHEAGIEPEQREESPENMSVSAKT
jgi:hypothetical protein